MSVYLRCHYKYTQVGTEIQPLRQLFFPPVSLTTPQRRRRILRDCWIAGYALRLREQGLAESDAEEAAESAWYALAWEQRAAWLGVREVREN